MRLRRRALTLFAAGLIAGAVLAWLSFGPRYQIVSGGANSVFGYARVDIRTGETNFFLFDGKPLGKHPKGNWWEADKLANPFDKFDAPVEKKTPATMTEGDQMLLMTAIGAIFGGAVVAVFALFIRSQRRQSVTAAK